MTARRTRSGEELLQLRRRRMAASPPILRGGFRPFFLAAGLWAVAAIALWIFSLNGDIAFPRGLDPLAWHRHEMVFGFAGAAVAGFLLTAIPNWTGRLPIAGLPLAALVALWIAARLGLLVLPARFIPVGAVLDVGLYAALAAFAMREVVASGNRNLPVSLLVLLFGGADALDHLAMAGAATDDLLGIRCGLSILMIMISVIGGRIVPSFTRNWMVKQGLTGRLPGQPGRYDMATIAVTAAALLGWIARPSATAVGAALVAAALLQTARLAR
ncbi:MAG: NnrS family protein, partial [Proteobacteria bacterium]|nr:NnrS family protein [Pseudomonadota bacterium]